MTLFVFNSLSQTADVSSGARGAGGAGPAGARAASPALFAG